MGNGTAVDTTENHPFYVKGKSWCAAAELEEGDVLRTQDGETEVVEDVQIEQLDEAAKVYNLEIEDSYTYYVSADGVLVHNQCGNDDVLEMNPKDINFSQKEVNGMFDTPFGKISIEKALRQGPGQVEDFLPIRVMNMNGQYVVRDGNSRLLIAQKTKAESIKVIIENSLDAWRDSVNDYGGVTMIIRDQKNHLSINTEELEEKLSRITEWEEWYNLKESLFRLSEWKYADIETLERQSERDNIVMDGHEWMPLADPCDIDREISYLHEMARWYVFEKLEPEAYADNLSRKEEYGKECSFCLRYTEDFDVENCAFCGRKLTLIYLENFRCE